MTNIAEGTMKVQVEAAVRALGYTAGLAPLLETAGAPATVYRTSTSDASRVVAGTLVAYSLPMVSVARDEAQRRKASIEAACRIALRMANSGRGSESALAFLQSVTGRELSGVAMIVGNGDEQGRDAAPNAVSDASYWATPTRARSGELLGELRLAAATSNGLDDVDRKALTSVARAAARILSRTGG